MVTLAELKNYLNIKNNSLDTALQGFLESAINRVKTYTNNNIEVTEYIEFYDGTGTNLLPLRNFPVIEDSIFIEYYDSNSWVAVDVNDISVVNYNTCLLNRKDIFYKGDANYRVYYRAGYKTIPPEIKTAVLELASLYFQNSKYADGKLGYRQKSRADTNEIFDLEAEREVLKKIDKYYIVNI